MERFSEPPGESGRDQRIRQVVTIVSPADTAVRQTYMSACVFYCVPVNALGENANIRGIACCRQHSIGMSVYTMIGPVPGGPESWSIYGCYGPCVGYYRGQRGGGVIVGWGTPGVSIGY